MKHLFFIAALLCATLCAQAQSADEAAIKAVIERETQAYHNADAAAMIDCWANVPQSLQHGAYLTAEGKYEIFRNTNEKTDLPEKVKKGAADAKPDGITFQNTDYVFRITGNAAFVQYEQTETDPKGTKTYAHEVRYLEKIGGQWKIIYVGVIFYKK